MKSRIFQGVVVVALMCLVYRAGYQSGERHARYGVLIAGYDSPDAPQAEAQKSETEPYFTRRNEVPSRLK